MELLKWMKYSSNKLNVIIGAFTAKFRRNLWANCAVGNPVLSIVHPTIAHHSINFAQLLHQRFKIRYGNYLEGIRVEQMQLATNLGVNELRMWQRGIFISKITRKTIFYRLGTGFNFVYLRLEGSRGEFAPHCCAVFVKGWLRTYAHTGSGVFMDNFFR